MRVSYSPGYYAPIPDTHIFPMRKFEGLKEYLLGRLLISEDQIVIPSLCPFEDLELAHTPRYSRGVWTGSLSQKEIRRLGLPWSKGLGIRSRLAVQGTINAAKMALEDGISGNLAGGTHHAMPNHGEGFCVYNDVAVATLKLLRDGLVRKVLILDCDVHQGNGTAEILRGHSDVYTFSMHGERNYPFVKPPSTLDIPLRDGTTDAVYLRELELALSKIASEFKPDLVFYLAGIDPLESDHFGRLALTMTGLAQREETVIRWAGEQNLPLVLLLSGGYAPTLKETVLAHAVVFEKALALAPDYY